MPNFRVSLASPTLSALKEMLKRAEHRGDLRTVKRVDAILSVTEGYAYSVIASILNVCEESIRLWFRVFLLRGLDGIKSSKSPERPSKLAKKQRTELDEIITDGPTAAGYPGACWRSPMFQQLIYERFGVLYSVTYIVQLLKNMGFSYQKARFVSDHKDPERRREWLEKTWPEVMNQAKQKDAHILFGDEASFPQWGTLTYTWAKRRQQTTVPTSGIRKGYKVFRLIDYFTGRFLYKVQLGRLTSETYSEFLRSVLDKTQKHIILIQDGARHHTSKAMQKFFEEHKERITVHPLPSYSPDYNTIEKPWKEIKKDGTHLHYFPTFDDLVLKVDEILLTFSHRAQRILSLFGMYDELTNCVGEAA